MKQQISIAVVVAAIMTCGVISRAESNSTNPQVCGHQFSSADFQNKEIAAAIHRYDPDTNPDPELVNQLANFGAAVIPYMARLDCKTKLRFYFMNPKAGFFGWYHDRAYTALTHAVISKISDPAAIPDLQKIFFDPRLGRAAQDAVMHISSKEPHGPLAAIPGPSISKETLKKIIDRDASQYMTRYNLSRYLIMVRQLPKEDQAEVLLYLFDSKRLAPGLSYSTGAGAGKAFVSTLDIDNWKVLVQVLGRTENPEARNLLKNQYASLSRGPAAAPDILKPVLDAYKIALSPTVAPNKKFITDTWLLPLDLVSVPYGMTTRATAIVSSISVDGNPLIDAEGKRWMGRSVELTERDGPRFYKHIEILFHTKTPQSEKPLALVSVIDSARGDHVENLIECIPSAQGASN